MIFIFHSLLLLSTQDLVPCIPVTFRKEQIVIWRGNDYKPPESEIFLDQLKSRDEVDSESSTHDERGVEDSDVEDSEWSKAETPYNREILHRGNTVILFVVVMDVPFFGLH